jgi:hypothetical protein
MGPTAERLPRAAGLSDKLVVVADLAVSDFSRAFADPAAITDERP